MQNMFVLIVPMKATSNQKASPWTVPEVLRVSAHISTSVIGQTSPATKSIWFRTSPLPELSMWNSRGISILCRSVSCAVWEVLDLRFSWRLFWHYLEVDHMSLCLGSADVDVKCVHLERKDNKTSQECETALMSQYQTLVLVFVFWYFFSFCLSVFLSRLHPNQMSEGSHVSKDTLCVEILKCQSVSDQSQV